MAYDPPIGSAILFDLSGGYTPPDGGAIIFGGAVVPPAPGPVYPGKIAVPWSDRAVADHRSGSGWQRRRALSCSIGCGFIGLFRRGDRATDTPWTSKGSADRKRDIPWGDLEAIQPSIASPWSNPASKDQQRDTPWGYPSQVQHSVAPSYIYPAPRDIHKRIAFEKMPVVDLVAFDLPWANPPHKDRLHRTLWGRKTYERICLRGFDPPAGDGVNLNLHVPISQVDDGDHIGLRFSTLSYDLRCQQREPSGWRDAYFYRPPQLIPSGVIANWYLLVNTAYLTRLPDNAPVDCLSASVSIDVDSWCWTFEATIGSEAALTLLKPTSSGTQRVQLTINGWQWIFRVESWRKSERFGQTTRTISGRSESMLLAEPYAERTSYTESQSRTAKQIVEDALLYTGWTVDWNIDDWLVPGGCLSYADATPMQVVLQVAGAAGAVVQSDTDSQELIIQPRYAAMPWAWSGTTPSLIIPDSLITSMDGEWESRPVLNAAFVAGTMTGGISARVIRQGSAGDIAAQIVTDPLITATEVARMRGSNILAASGDWSTATIGLPLMAAPTVPGLILPGTLIEVQPAVLSAWRCQVIGTSISVSWQDGVSVRQSLSVERYHGN